MSNLFSSGGAGNVGASGITQQSLKFNDDESQYLSWTPAAAGNRKTFTLSMWFKLGNLPTSDHYLFGTGVSGSATQSWIYFNSSNSNKLTFGIRVSSSNYQITIDPLYRDPSAWYHLVYSVDTTQSTAADRVKIYVNGSQVTDFVSSSYPPQNSDTSISDAVPQVLGANNAGSGSFFDGYLSNIHFIDGQALDATSFGQFTNGYWEAKDYAGTYGTNGFHLTFEDDVVSEGFNAVTYRGTGVTNSVSGLGFSPDLVWIKQRSGAAFHNVFDSLRVVGGDHKRLYTNSTIAEESSTYSGTTNLTSLDGDGFSLGTGTDTNNSGSTYVAWAWDAGSGSAASNTDGSITSTVKANPSYGFSIVSYVGNYSSATIGHGLSSAPAMILLKNRTQSADWVVYHSALNITGSEYLRLNQTNSVYSSSTVWNDTETTSSVFSTGANGLTNNSGESYIAYCFAEVAGYSSFGSYSGTGASGNAVTGLGFKPAWLMIRRTDVASDWIIWDSTRDVDGKIDGFLYPNLSVAEAFGSNVCTFDSDGFTLNDGTANRNASGGTYIYMAFADTREAAFWKDVSGQGNHWTPNNLDYRDSLPDSPANNFATHNPLASLGGMTFFEGNTKVRHADIGSYNHARSTMGMTTGKWYWEWYNSGSSGDAPTQLSGIVNDAAPISTSNGYVGQNANGYSYSEQGFRYNNGSNIGTISVPTGDSSGIWMLAYDADDGKLYVGKNGTWANSGDPAAGTGALFTGIDTATTWYPAGYTINNDVGRWRDIVVNHGQDSTFSGAKLMGAFTDDNDIGNFQYAPPAGYLALCTANLPTPTIIDGSENFNTVLYTGNASTQSITGVGFQPDFVWLKDRSVTGRDHQQIDSVRGATKTLKSSATVAEATLNSVTSFDSDGFTLGNESGANASGSSLVGWNWKAGGAAVSNTDGSITSQVSANTDAGFSIVSWTGSGSAATIGHSLGVQPSMIIVKNRIDARNWSVWHKDLSSNDYYLRLDSTDAQASAGANYWNSTAPTSSVFSVGVEGDVNDSGDAMIAYCFANTDTTKAGSYTGNGSSDGPFVYTGFRPAWIMYKRSDAGLENWEIFDTARDAFNDMDDGIKANTSDSEGDLSDFDLLSNGFKVRTSATRINISGGTYIYLAFAESPFKYANAR